MTRWWTSDPHYGHENIIRYCGRPFPNAKVMGETMVERWNDVVADTDEVWILGDLILGNLDACLTEYVARLKGRKILVPGNHDQCWMGKKKGGRNHARYIDLGGIAKIVDVLPVVKIDKTKVKINHFPYSLHLMYDEKFRPWCTSDNGSWLLHGHIHEKWRQNGRQINVGVDAWDFRPIHDDTIAALIKAGPTMDVADHYVPAEWC